LGDAFLFGTDEGLYAFESREPNARLVPLSNRRYSQINTVPDLGIMISRSGKYDVVSVHDVSAFSKIRRKSKFETETHLKKMKETTGCNSYTLVRARESLYLCVSMAKSVMVMKWAPHPFNRFMKLKVK
jgi:hypothetical protein